MIGKKSIYQFCLLGLLISPLLGGAQLPAEVNLFPLSEVRLLEGPFKQAEGLDIQYLLALDADRLLAPYYREAGLSWEATSYGNWENTGLDGHIGGHYLSALALMYASTGNQQIKERLEYMLFHLKRCQEASGNGYLGGVPGGKTMWQEVAEGKIKAGSFELNKKWVPLYNIHKIYAGLRDAWIQAGYPEAKEMLIRLTDWMFQLVKNLTDEQIQEMLRSEHGGLNEIFADVAAITGEAKYLGLARQFSHQLVLQPLLRQEDRLNGMHANTQIPKVIGFEWIAELGGDTDWHKAACFFWETVVRHRSVSIGGNSVREHFHSSTDFSSMVKSEQGPETCNTYNMLRLTRMLYQIEGKAGYLDYYERALYNHILSTQHPQQGGFVYFTPMRPGHYRVYSQPQTSFWCCVGSGLENHAKYGEMIYAYKEKEIYVNLFIASQFNWKAGKLELIQQTAFPDEAATTLTVNPEKAAVFAVCLRCPEWTEAGRMKVWVNEKLWKTETDPDQYVRVKRRWKKGDRVRVELPMHLSVEQMPDSSAWYSLKYGPLVLAAKTGTEEMKGLFADDSRGGHIASGKKLPLQEMPAMVGTPAQILSHISPVAGKSLTFRMDGLSPEKYNLMEWIPFFRLHEARYVVYWPLVSPGEYAEKQKQLAEQERRQAELDQRTVDRVICGEQQPESDHFIRSGDSRAGTSEEWHWREARKDFGYRFENQEQKAVSIQLKCLGRESAGRTAWLWVNERKVAEIKIDKNEPKEVVTLEYAVPADLQKERTWQIKLEAAGTLTPRFCELRLLKN